MRKHNHLFSFEIVSVFSPGVFVPSCYLQDMQQEHLVSNKKAAEWLMRASYWDSTSLFLHQSFSNLYIYVKKKKSSGAKPQNPH